jgi:NAD/NADP transhydrogenase beta subunit
MNWVLSYSFFRPITGLIAASFCGFIFNQVDLVFLILFDAAPSLFSDLDNELFYMDKTMTVFGDAKKVIKDMVNTVE